jgi:hypothetical protein
MGEQLELGDDLVLDNIILHYNLLKDQIKPKRPTTIHAATIKTTEQIFAHMKYGDKLSNKTGKG